MNETPTAAELVARINAFLDRMPFERVRDALSEGGDFHAVNRALGDLGLLLEERIDPEIELDYTKHPMLVPESPGDFTFHGREGWVELWRLWFEPWERLRIETTVEEIDRERALAEARFFVEGRGSGAPVNIEVVSVWTVRDGRIVRVEVFETREVALDAAGVGREATDA